MAHARPSWWALYAEPVLGILGCIVVLGTFAAVGRIADTRPNDFTVFLESARWLRQGADLYQRPLQSGPGYNLNTPAAILLFVPFSYLPDALALRLWTVLAIAAYTLAAWWIARAAAPGRMVSVAATVLLCQGAISSLLLGHLGAPLMLLVTAAWVADRGDRLFRGGLLIGVAVGAKPFLAVVGAYAIWRRSRALAAGLGTGFALVVVAGLALGGMSAYRSWFAALGTISWTGHVLNGSVLGLLTRTLSATPIVLHATPVVDAPQLVQPLWWVSVAAVAAIGGRALLRTRDRDAAWALVLVASLLASPLGWVYYAPIAAAPLVAVALKASTSIVRAMMAAGYACLLIPPAGSTGGVGTLVHGSIYTWGLLLLFAGVVLATRRTSSHIHAASVAQK